MSKPTDRETLAMPRLDRILATMALGLIVLTIGCFAALMIGANSGADPHAGVWPAVAVTVYVAPILAFVLMLSVIVMAIVRRARANRAR